MYSPFRNWTRVLQSDFISLTFFASGFAIKCWECNSQYDHRCGEAFDNFTVALVDCDQRSSDVAHIDRENMVRYNAYTVAEAKEIPDTSKATVCRKTTQIGRWRPNQIPKDPIAHRTVRTVHRIFFTKKGHISFIVKFCFIYFGLILLSRHGTLAQAAVYCLWKFWEIEST